MSPSRRAVVVTCLCLLGLVGARAGSRAQTLTLADGSLTVAIRTDSGAIHSANLAGVEFFRFGTFVSDWGLQVGTDTTTFVFNDAFGGARLPVSVVAAAGGVEVTGTYTRGGADIDVYRRYELVAGRNSLRVITRLTNRGSSAITLTGFESFDPDPGSSFSTFNDVFPLAVTGGTAEIGRAYRADGFPRFDTFLLCAPTSHSTASGGPFQIDSGDLLNGLIDAPFDGNNTPDDEGTHTGYRVTLAPSETRTAVVLLAFGLDFASPATQAQAACAATDLRVEVTESTDPVASGSGAGGLEHVVTVTNAGLWALAEATIVVGTTVPTGVSATVTPGQGSYSAGTWTLGALAPGASASLTVSFDVGPTAPEGTDLISTTATVGSSVPVAILTSDDSASVATSVERLVDLGVSLGHPATTVAGSGPQNLVFQATVTNQGPSNATAVKLSKIVNVPAGASLDAVIPSGAGTYASGVWTLDELEVGQSETLTTYLTVGASAGDATTIQQSVAILDTAETRTDTQDDQASGSAVVDRQPDLAISILDLADPITTGEQQTYLVTVTNNGPSDSAGVTVTDTLPAGLTGVSAIPSQGLCLEAPGVVTCPLGALAAGASADIQLLATVGPDAVGTLTNSVSAVPAAGETDPTSPTTAEAMTTVIGEADLSLSLTASPEPAAPGGALTYHFTVVNAGTSTATAVVVTTELAEGLSLADPAPPPVTPIFADGFESGDLTAWSSSLETSVGTFDQSDDAAGLPGRDLALRVGADCAQEGRTLSCPAGDLAAGTSVSFDVELRLDSGLGSSVTSTSEVTSDTQDPDPSNNSASVTSTLRRRFDLSLTMADSADPVFPGGSLSYSLEVTNHGPSAATLVTTSIPLPPELILLSAAASQGTCTQASHVVCDLGTLGGGTTTIITIHTAVANSAVGAITTGATVTAAEPERDLVNNQAIEVTTVSSSLRSPSPGWRSARLAQPLTFGLSEVSMEREDTDRGGK